MRALTAFLAALLASGGAFAGDIWKCRNADGSAYFQERPCSIGPGGNAVATVRVVAVTAEGSTKDPAKLQLMNTARAEVMSRLKDPFTARFARLLIAEHSDGAMVACGLVNSKNSFGAYTGPRGFMFHSREKRAILEQDRTDFAVKFRGWCALE